MYKRHYNIETPSADEEIWKYMDLWKFLDILDNSRLFFCQAIKFEDKLDGRIPTNKLKHAHDEHPLKQVDKFSQTTLKRSHYVNCWSNETTETFPLWKIYSDYRTAVAIKSTVGKLIESLAKDDKDQYIGKVNYVNPNKDYYFKGNTFQFFYEKRDYFFFENEIRVITILNYKDDRELLELPSGLYVEVGVTNLIEEIKLAPLANESFKKLIELKLMDSKLNIPVSFSEI